MATIMRFLISILLLLALPVYGQLNPTAFSKGMINTNDTAAKWRDGIGALAITNGTSRGLTNIGNLYVSTNPANPTAEIWLKDKQRIFFGDNQRFFIMGEEGHPGGGEMHITSYGSISLNVGYDGARRSVCQMGSSGEYNDVFYLQYDYLANSNAKPLGYSKFLGFANQRFNGTATVYQYPGIMGQAFDTNGNTGLEFYANFAGYNQAMGQATIKVARLDTNTFYIPRLFVTNKVEIGKDSTGVTSGGLKIGYNAGTGYNGNGDGGLDIASGALGFSPAIMFGADINASTRSNNTDKYGMIAMAPYGTGASANALVHFINSGGATRVYFGGYTGTANAPTHFEFRVATNIATSASSANTKTAIHADVNGVAMFHPPDASASATLDVNGSGRFRAGVTADTTLTVGGKSPVLAVFTQTNDVTTANTATESKLSGSGVGSLIIPANYLTVGKTYKVEMEGFYSTADIVTLTFRLRLGGVAGTVIGETRAIDQSDAESNQRFHLSALITYRGANTVVCSGGAVLMDAGPGQIWNIPLKAPSGSSSTITPSSALEITPTVKWSTALSGNTLTCQILTVTEMN